MRFSGSESGDLALRTRQYAARIIRLYAALPKTVPAQIIGKQLLRSGTSVGAHVAESKRGRSSADFANKVDGALQELEESLYWMNLLIDTKIFSPAKLRDLMDETNQIIAILVTMARRTRRSMNKG